MTIITIIAKESHSILQQTTANDIHLTENSVVVVNVSKDDVQTLVRDGNSLVVTLKNG